jgi:Ca2+-binding RTX toxin-like protein
MPATFATLPGRLAAYGFNGKSIAAIDLNADGILETVVFPSILRGPGPDFPMNWPASDPVLRPAVILQFNRTTGLSASTLVSTTNQPFVSGWVMDITVADFNGDGRPDMLWSDTGPEVFVNGNWPLSHLRLALSTPAGPAVSLASVSFPNQSFAASFPGSGWGFWHSHGAADLDGDGDIDFLATNSQGGQGFEQFTAAFLNDGHGNFSYAPNFVPPARDLGVNGAWLTPSTVSLVDINGDNRAEMIFGTMFATSGTPNPRENRIYWNTPTGYQAASYTALPYPLAAALGTHSLNNIATDRIRIADLNKDGLNDILFFYSDYQDGSPGRWGQVWLQNPDRSFRELQIWPGNVLPQLRPWADGASLEAVDVNGDGLLDIQMTQDNLPNLTDAAKCVWINMGDETFQSLDTLAPNLLPSIQSTALWRFVDMDGDGQAELLTSHFSGASPDTVLSVHVLQPNTLQAVAGQALTGTIFGDTMTGTNGADQISGGLGHDTLDGRAGRDSLFGGQGNDILISRASEYEAGRVFDGGPGVDTLRTIGSVDYRTSTVTSFERIAFERAGAEATINLMFNASQLASFGAATVVSGSAVQDSIQIFVGSGATVNISGWQFDFPAWSLEDYIVYVGDNGNETFIGFAGLDIFFGSPGNDTYDGRGAFDFAAYIFSPNAVTADLAIQGVAQVIGGNQGSDTFLNLEGLAGSQLGDNLFGDNGANIILSLGGDDVINGRGGADDLRGGDGNDRIEGGAGADTLLGEAGADRFVYRTAAEGGDTISDFVAGTDKIEVSAAGFGGGLTAGGAVTLISGVNPVASGGSGVFLYSTTTGVLSWDADGAGGGAAVVLATLTGRPAIAAGDIVVTSIAAASVEGGMVAPEADDHFNFDDSEPAQTPEVCGTGDPFGDGESGWTSDTVSGADTSLAADGGFVSDPRLGLETEFRSHLSLDGLFGSSQFALA